MIPGIVQFCQPERTQTIDMCNTLPSHLMTLQLVSQSILRTASEITKGRLLFFQMPNYLSLLAFFINYEAVA